MLVGPVSPPVSCSMAVPASHTFVYIAVIHAAGQGERHFLRVLMCVVKGAQSFEELRTVDDVVCLMFKEAAIRRGLLEDDAEHDATMAEAVTVTSPKQLRQLFCFYLVHVPLQGPHALWQRYKEHMMEDFVHRNCQVSD